MAKSQDNIHKFINTGDFALLRKERENRQMSGPETYGFWQPNFLMFREHFYSDHYLKLQDRANWKQTHPILKAFAGLMFFKLRKEGVPIWVQSATLFTVDIRHSTIKVDDLGVNELRLIDLIAEEVKNTLPLRHGIITGGNALRYKLHLPQDQEYIPEPGREQNTLGNLHRKYKMPTGKPRQHV